MKNIRALLIVVSAVLISTFYIFMFSHFRSRERIHGVSVRLQHLWGFKRIGV